MLSVFWPTFPVTQNCQCYYCYLKCETECGWEKKNREAVLLELTAAFPHSCRSANIQVKVSNDSDRSWNRWQVRDEKLRSSSNWLWGVTVEEKHCTELLHGELMAFSFLAENLDHYRRFVFTLKNSFQIAWQVACKFCCKLITMQNGRYSGGELLK